MIKRSNPLCLLLFSVLLFANSILSAQEIQRPEEFLPHAVGEQFTEHYQLVDYFEYLAEQSPKTMLLESYGATNEDRPLMTAIFSSPRNMKNLENIRLNHLADAGFNEGTGARLNQSISIVWLSMSVHGNEPSGSECSIELAYQLAQQADPQIVKWLENTIVILDPSLNPDGYSRYSHWYRGISALHPIAHPEAREHKEPWPGGRVNHYLFDLNRDWAWSTQIESQQRLKVYQKWLPHVHADLHEQYINNPYYFAPAAEPMHHFITPFQREFQSTIGQNHAHYFDKNGWLYFTREVFDLFYPSYGDTYPMFNGAIGMTYEQAGHGLAGRAIETANGDTLRLNDRVMHHLTTSLSTIETASKKADHLTKAFNAYYKEAQNNPPGKFKSYVIKKDNYQDALQRFLGLLDRHSIRYSSADYTRSATGFDYSTGEKNTYSIEKGDIIIDAYQPQATLLQVLMEPESKLSDTLTYDITAWSLPFAYGLKAFANENRLKADAPFAGFESPTLPKAPEQTYAWCVPHSGLKSAQFIAYMQQKGYHLRVAQNGFSTTDQMFEEGTIVVNKADNKQKWENAATDVLKFAEMTDIEVSAIESSWAIQGPNFGSTAFQLIDNKPIAVAYGHHVDANAYGFVWHFFEQDLNLPFVALNLDQVKKINAYDYGTLILPEGKYNFDEDDLENLVDFVQDGGRLIASGIAIKAFGPDSGFAIEIKEMDGGSKEKQLPNFLNKERGHVSNSLPGAIVKLTLDKSHPMTVGMGDSYFTLKTSPLTLNFSDNADVVGYIDDSLTHFGFIGHNVKGHLKNSAPFVVQEKGAGKAIFFTDDPLFRGFWYQGKVLFSNALFY